MSRLRLSRSRHVAQEIPSDTIIPAYPMLMADSEVTDLSSSAGAVGIMRNGVSVFRYRGVLRKEGVRDAIVIQLRAAQWRKRQCGVYNLLAQA